MFNGSRQCTFLKTIPPKQLSKTNCQNLHRRQNRKVGNPCQVTQTTCTTNLNSISKGRYPNTRLLFPKCMFKQTSRKCLLPTTNIQRIYVQATPQASFKKISPLLKVTFNIHVPKHKSRHSYKTNCQPIFPTINHKRYVMSLFPTHGAIPLQLEVTAQIKKC